MHMRTLMVGVDGSPVGAAASQWAARVAVRAKAELVVASAWHREQAEGDVPEVAARREESRSQLEGAWSDPARQEEAVVRTLLLDGHADALLGAAEHEQIDLLVVGTRGAGGPASLHLGSVAHHLARHTKTPLAIVPEPVAGDGPTKIALGVDGSPSSLAAVQWCAGAASALGLSVVAVVAFEPFLEWVTTSDPGNWRRTLEEHLTTWIEPLRAARVPVELEIIRDVHPVEAIASTALAHSCDLIVVGTHGLGGFTGMRLGGVAVQLVHHVALPVVLVPQESQS